MQYKKQNGSCCLQSQINVRLKFQQIAFLFYFFTKNMVAIFLLVSQDKICCMVCSLTPTDVAYCSFKCVYKKILVEFFCAWSVTWYMTKIFCEFCELLILPLPNFNKGNLKKSIASPYTHHWADCSLIISLYLFISNRMIHWAKYDILIGPGFKSTGWPGAFCVEFASFPSACVGFLWALQLPPTR